MVINRLNHHQSSNRVCIKYQLSTRPRLPPRESNKQVYLLHRSSRRHRHCEDCLVFFVFSPVSHGKQSFYQFPKWTNRTRGGRDKLGGSGVQDFLLSYTMQAPQISCIDLSVHLFTGHHEIIFTRQPFYASLFHRIPTHPFILNSSSLFLDPKPP